MSAAGVLVDSGLAYCIAHAGVIDCDASICDFRDRDEPEYRCVECTGKGWIEGDESDDETVHEALCRSCAGDGITPCQPRPLLYSPEAS